MQSYLTHSFDADDPGLISAIDELSLWSAPFGLKLLELIRIRPGMKVLDIGCGPGFPLIEIAQRLGSSGDAVGLDPWSAALRRVRQKIETYGLKNVEVVNGVAEKIPFPDQSFDLLVSNNGINNVSDLKLSLAECYRASRPGAQFIVSFNLERTMHEFYDAFEETLYKNGLESEIEKMREHIYSKRRPLEEMKQFLIEAGFAIRSVVRDAFGMNFVDAATMFNHSLIKYWFLNGWKAVLQQRDLERIFEEIEQRMNAVAREKGEIRLTVPFVVIDMQRI